jgi:hypothetical protein
MPANGSNTHAYADSHAGSHADPDSYTHAYTHTYSDTNAYSYPDTNARERHPYRYLDRHYNDHGFWHRRYDLRAHAEQHTSLGDAYGRWH